MDFDPVLQNKKSLKSITLHVGLFLEDDFSWRRKAQI